MSIADETIEETIIRITRQCVIEYGQKYRWEEIAWEIAWRIDEDETPESMEKSLALVNKTVPFWRDVFEKGAK